ncbi:MAG: type I-E CRISPR-associated protein Cse2/CasB [Proteobacteria bacterium]|nr:type I-E CRISPR-associated protein Cse2/CasB [Pseudomonadota bacterium]
MNLLRFDKDSPETESLRAWWRWLDENRGERAVLRRCGTLTDVAFSPAYHRLRSAVNRFGFIDDDGLALVAGLAARIKDDIDSGSIAEQMATAKSGGDAKARISGLRFRRLLKVKEREDLFSAMTRVIALLGGSVNMQSLAQGVYFWNDKTRKQWAFDYYSKALGEA